MKKQLIGTVDPFCYILNSLRTKRVPKSKMFSFLEFCYMLFDSIGVYALLKASIVSTVQGNQVIVDPTGNVDFAIEMLVALGVV